MTNRYKSLLPGACLVCILSLGCAHNAFPGFDRAHPVYATSFDANSVLEDWRLEGGREARLEQGSLVLDTGSKPDGKEGRHLVYWLNREMPADFLLEFTFRPENRRLGLAIVFFNTRGIHGESIFDPALAGRDGTFPQYHSGDLNGYHISYWAAGRGTAHLRKNKGFHQVAAGEDLVTPAPADAFQTIQICKRGGHIQLLVDGRPSFEWQDDGTTYGPVHTHSGWIGLRQMSHAGRCAYGRLAVYPAR